MDELKNIGFYTLEDGRARRDDPSLPLWRCELILTESCNFKCPYCRGLRTDCSGTLPFQIAQDIVAYWVKNRLKNVRFSGGEPLMYIGLRKLVRQARDGGVERIAISSNGSFPTRMYQELIDDGVNDFSISLDACCAEDVDKMSGRKGHFDNIIHNIKYLTDKVYTTVGVVLTPENVATLNESIEFASNLGVNDIRIISAAQYNEVLEEAKKIPQAILDRHPILAYRVKNILNGRNVRGIESTDSNKCVLVQDDMAIAAGKHFPCIIYLREGGDPIGVVGKTMQEDRIEWYKNHNSHDDPICKKNCLDVCIDYNNRCRTFAN